MHRLYEFILVGEKLNSLTVPQYLSGNNPSEVKFHVEKSYSNSNNITQSLRTGNESKTN